VNRRIRRAMARDERKIRRRLDDAMGGQKRRSAGPEFAGNPRLEFAERTRAMAYGGVGVMLKLARGKAGRNRVFADELDMLRAAGYTEANGRMVPGKVC